MPGHDTRKSLLQSAFFTALLAAGIIVWLGTLGGGDGRPWRALSGLVDTDWYPASYPWHCVLELPAQEKKVKIAKGEPLARIIPVRRDTYFAAPMALDEFARFFERGQQWLTTHGRPGHDAEEGEGVVDLQRTYVKQQMRSRFVILR